MQQEVKQTWCRNCGHSEIDHHQWNPDAPIGQRRESAPCYCGCINFWPGGKEFRSDLDTSIDKPASSAIG